MININHIYYHFIFNIKSYFRNKILWIKMFFIIPINTVIPFYLMTKAFLGEYDVKVILLTNLMWSYIYFTVIESFISKERVVQSSKLNGLLITPSNIVNWIAGQTLSINIFYIFSIIISLFFLNIVSGLEIEIIVLIRLIMFSVIASFSINLLVFSIQLMFSRVFHLVNLSLDIFESISCVFYPLIAIPMVVRTFAIFSPVTWMNEFLRKGQLIALSFWILTSIIFIIIGLYIVNRQIERFKKRGGLFD